MKKKLSKLLRCKTQQFSIDKTSQQINTSNTQFSIKLTQNFTKCFKNECVVQQKLHRKIQPLVQKPKIRIKQQTSRKQNFNYSHNNISSTVGDFYKKKSSQQSYNSELINKIAHQIIKDSQLGAQTIIQNQLNFLIKVSQDIIEEIYFYNRIQNRLKSLNQRIKTIGSKSLIFQVYTFTALVYFTYGNYSLSIFYFDKALKKEKEIQIINKQQKQRQIQIYKTIAKIFILKNEINIAKQFAYKYLRKAWFCQNFDQQLNAYDILGKIYKQAEQKDMSIYFHNKMCRGDRQNKQIIRLSNYELQKSWNQIKEFAVYQTIQVFVEKDKIFHQMLEDRYRMKKRSYQGQQFQIKNHFYLHTNRSPNRNLNTYRVLQRKMIQQKKSKQLHFLKPKETANLKKVVNEFIKLLRGLQTATIANQFAQFS